MASRSSRGARGLYQGLRCGSTVPAQGIGVPLTGYLRDATGSYGPVLAAVIVAGLIAAVVVLRVRLPEALQRPPGSRT